MKDRRDLRMSLGMTQLKMAMLLGITRAHWSMYESGRRSLPSAVLQSLAVITHNVKGSPEHDVNQNRLMRDAQSKHDRKRLKEIEFELMVAQRDFEAESKKQLNYSKRIRVKNVVDALGGKVGGRPVFFMDNTPDEFQQESADRLVELKHLIDTLRLEQEMLLKRKDLSAELERE